MGPSLLPEKRGVPNSEVDLYTALVGTVDSVFIREVSLIHGVLERFPRIHMYIHKDVC